MNQSIKKNLIRLTMEQASIAIANWNSPFWAVLTDLDGNVVATCYNTTSQDFDPTAHAEINLIRYICKKLCTKDLSNYILFSNAESCPMCLSAAIKAKIRHFYFWAPTEIDANPYIKVDEISSKTNPSVYIETWILKDECQKQIQEWRKILNQISLSSN